MTLVPDCLRVEYAAFLREHLRRAKQASADVLGTSDDLRQKIAEIEAAIRDAEAHVRYDESTIQTVATAIAWTIETKGLVPGPGASDLAVTLPDAAAWLERLWSAGLVVRRVRAA